MKKLLKLITLLAIAISFLMSCAGNTSEYDDPDSREKREELAEQFSPQEEYFIGRSVAAIVLGKKKLWNKGYYSGAVETPTMLEKYITNIGSTIVLASSRPVNYDGYRFIILDDDQINAFATPGGFIFITSGLIKVAENEDEVAAVLAHEASHCMLRHPLQSIALTRKAGVFSEFASVLAEGLGKASGLSPTQYQKMADVMEESVDAAMMGVLTGYNHMMEYEADTEAVGILVKAGYNPYSWVNLIKKLQEATAKKGGTYHSNQDSDYYHNPQLRIDAVTGTIEKLNTTIPPISAARTERFERNTAELYPVTLDEALSGKTGREKEEVK